MMQEQQFTFDRVIRILITVAVVLGIFWVLGSLSSVLIPFFLAVLLAYLVNPMVNWVEKRIKKRVLAVLLTLFSLLFFAIGIFSIVLPLIGKEIDRFQELLGAYSSNIELPMWVPEDLLMQLESKIKGLSYEEVLAQEGIGDAISIGIGNLWNGLTGIFGFLGSLIGLVTLILYLIFILIDYKSLTKGWKDYLPPKYKTLILMLARDVEVGMNAYFKAQSRIVLTVAILFAVGFKLIGLPLGILLGLSVGLLNYVPYLQIAGMIPAAFLAVLHSLETGNNVWLMLGLVLLVFGLVQLIQDAFLTPKIMGDMTGLNPAVMLLALSIWGSWLGLVGMIIALPMTTLLISYYKRFILGKERIETGNE